MRKRRQYVKTCKCYHRLPTIEETEEFGTWRSNRTHRLWRQNVSVAEVDFEDCTTWGFASFKAKLAKLQDLRQNLQPPAKQLMEKMKETYDDMMVFVAAKTEQVRAVQSVWPGN